MLSILGPADRKARFCDGLSRRNFLKIGGLGFGGLSLAQLLSLESQAGTSHSPKSVIMIYLVGGPPHQDHVRPEARRPARNRRAVQADRDQRAGHRDLRALPRLAQR